MEHVIDRAREHRAKARAIYQRWVADRPTLSRSVRKFMLAQLAAERAGGHFVARGRDLRQTRQKPLPPPDELSALRDDAAQLQAVHRELIALREEQHKLEALAAQLTDRVTAGIPAAQRKGEAPNQSPLSKH